MCKNKEGTFGRLLNLEEDWLSHCNQQKLIKLCILLAITEHLCVYEYMYACVRGNMHCFPRVHFYWTYKRIS